MIPELVLSASVALGGPASYHTQLKRLQNRLKKDGYDISAYLEDPRFEIYVPAKRSKDAQKKPRYINYADTTQSWYMRPDSIEKCADFLEEERKFFADLENEYGPAAEQFSMISQYELETHMGKFKGDRIAFNALVSKYLSRRGKSREMFYNYLKKLLYLVADTTDNITLPRDIMGIEGSRAGAIGDVQLMGNILRKYGKDGDGDGKVDPFNRYDGLTTLANFREQNGGDKDLPRAIHLYNAGHPFYQTSITAHKTELRKIMERREREFLRNLEPIKPKSDPITSRSLEAAPRKIMPSNLQNNPKYNKRPHSKIRIRTLIRRTLHRTNKK